MGRCDPDYYAPIPETFEITDVRNVWLENDLQLRSSTRFVYSNGSDFTLAKDILSEYPDLADPSRSRVQVN